MNSAVLVYDTETTGFIDKKLRPEDPKQPKLVSIAATLYRANGTRISDFNVIVKPDVVNGKPAWESTPGALAAHGITTEMAMDVGINRRVAVAMFTNLRRVAAVRVAHNQEFDDFVIACQLAEMGVVSPVPSGAKDVCTCQSDAVGTLVAVPPTAKQKRYFPEKKFKAPNLTELHRFLFNEGFEGAHGAGPDRDACARCYFELVKRGVL